MAKIIVNQGNQILQEVALTKERLTIGRRPHNDVVLNDPAVSGDHAVIVTLFNDSFLEDLRSTNGTLVNRLRTNKHILRHEDVIEIGLFRLRFSAEPDLASKAIKHAAPPVAACDVQYPTASTAPAPAETGNDAAATGACIHVMDGGGAGKKLFLTKPLTTIGKAGGQVAVIKHDGNDYFLIHIEGPVWPKVRGCDIGTEMFRLSDEDVIEIGHSRLRFVVKQPI